MPRPVLRLFLISIVTRTPYAAVGLLLIVRTRELTGSYAASGVVVAAASIAGAVVSPGVGRVIDRRGQTAVLAACAAADAAALTTFALLPHGVPLGALVAVAAIAGATVPPIGACLRTLYAWLLDGEEVHRAFAFESAALEITYIAGPLLMLGLASAAGTTAALIASAGVLAGGTLVFATTRESRGWLPGPSQRGPQGGAIRSPGLRTVLLAIALTGAACGAVEVSVAAACQAAHAKAATGVLLAVWGAGSMLGGIAAARAGAPADGGRRLAALLVAIGIGNLALVPVSSPAALVPVLVLAGIGIAPVMGTSHGLVGRVAPEGRQTEAFAWLTTAIGTGLAGGSALAGALVDGYGVGSGFAVAAAAGLVAAVITSARRSSLAQLAPVAAGT
jgi:MFS family permease